jgi:hypothetical protein
MDELQKLYNAVSAKFEVGAFEDFSAKMGDTDSRKRFYDVISSKGFDVGDYNDYETRLSGGTGIIPEPPKGAEAEASGGSVSPSASTESSSESNVNKPLADPMGLIKKEEPVNSFNTVTDFDMYKSRKAKIEDIDKKMFEIEKRADRFSKQGERSFEEIINSDGTYEDLKKQKAQLKQDNVLEDTLLEKIVEDTNASFGISSFLKNIFRTVGYKEDPNETIDINSKVQDQIIESLGDNNVMKEKIAKGYASLKEKENIITKAKVDVVAKENTRIQLEAEKVMANEPDDTIKQAKLEALYDEYNGLLGSVGYDLTEGILKNNFKKTNESAEFDEMLSSDGFLTTTGDATGTFLEELTQVAFKGTVGFMSDIISGGADIVTDQEHYSVYDAFGDTINQLGNFNILPTSEAESTKIITEEGKLNFSYKTAMKSLAQTLPFTLMIVNDAKKGKITSIEKTMGRFLNPTKSSKVTQSLGLIDSAYRHTFSDNLQDAKVNGLEGGKAMMYANTLSMAEGVAELIMPDTRFFKGNIGSGLLNVFKGDLKQASTRAGMKGAIKNFTTGIIGELGEEEIVLATQDLTKYAMIVGHKNSEFWDLQQQKELAAATILMSGVLGGINIKRDFTANKTAHYNKVLGDIHGVQDRLQSLLKDKNLTEEEKQPIVEAMNWANQLSLAASKAPQTVTGRALDLLMKKQKLIDEMKNVDDAFHPDYKEKIEKLNEGIRDEFAFAMIAEKEAAKVKKQEEAVQLEKANKKAMVIENTTKEVSRINSLSLEAEDGATLNQDGTNYKGKGLVVPIASVNMKQSELTPEAINDFIESNSESIGADNVKVGLYKFPNSDQVSIDLNIVVDPKYREQALEFGKQSGQESLYDLETFENIKTGGDGKNPTQYTPKQFKQISESLSKGFTPIIRSEVDELGTELDDFMGAFEQGAPDIMEQWGSDMKELDQQEKDGKITQKEKLAKQKELTKKRKEDTKNTKLQLDTDITPQQKKAKLEQEAIELMESVEGEGFTEETFTADEPSPKVKTHTLVIKENSDLAKKVRRMGLEELIGKKVNLVMADQLKVGEVKIGKKRLPRMGGHMFPLMDKLFGKVAWASINKSAAASIVNGAIGSDYTIVYNMSPSAVDSNLAILETFVESIKALPKETSNEIFTKLVEYMQTVKFGKKGVKTERVHKLARESTSLKDFEEKMGSLDVDTKAAILVKVLPSKNKKSTTEVGKLLQENKIDIEDLRALNIEQFVADLPAGAMTMVLEVQDKSGKKVTEETKNEALITSEQQRAEGLPEHQNYPVYVRGKAVAILKETVPFWNMFKSSMSSINAKVAGIIKNRASYSVVIDGKKSKVRETQNYNGSRTIEVLDKKDNIIDSKTISSKSKVSTTSFIEKNFGKVVKQNSKVSNISSDSARGSEMRSASMTANQPKKLSEVVTSSYENFIGLLQRAFPTIEMVTSEEAFNDLASQLGAKKLATKNQKIYGAVYQGKLYLNPALENFNTPVHEFGHVWMNTAKNARPELYNKGIELVKGSEYEQNVRESKEYQKVVKQMKADGATDVEIDNYIAEEALATAIGDKGESFVTAAQKKGFKNWLNSLYSFVRKLTGLSKMTPAQIQDMTLEDFVQGVAVDILSGNEIFNKSQVSALSDALQLHTKGKTDAELLVEYSRGKGYSDSVIQQALAKRGFSVADINAALAPNPLLTKMSTKKQVTKLNAALAGKIKTLKKKGSNKKKASAMPNTKLFTEAWDNALDLVADTVENTGNFAQGMYDGIESLRNSDWYRKLSNNSRASAERMFREDINRQYDGDKVQNSWRDSMKASMDKMKTSAIQKIVDKYHIVRKAMDENFDISDDSVNFSQAEINMHGKAANDIDKFDKQMEGIMKEISDKGLEVQNVSDYMYAKHATERNAYIKKNIDGENEFGSGMTPQEIDKILNETFTEDQIKDLEELSIQFQEIIKGTRDVMLESGLITEEQHAALSEFYENYVPLQGFENEEIVGSNQIQGKKLDVAGHLLERSSGRSTRADNVIANIVSSRVSAVVKARKNEVLQTLHKLGTENPKNGVFAVYTDETLPKTVKVDKTGKSIEQKEDARGREDYVGVKVDGEQYYMKFTNAELGRVLNASNIEKTNVISKMLRSMNRYLSTTLTTLNPEFVISNFSRDIQTAVLNVMAEADTNAKFKGQNIAKDVVKDTGKAIKAIFQNERMGKVDSEYQKFYEEFKADGAKTGWANQADISSIKKRMESMVRHNNAKGLTAHNAAAKGKAILNFVNDVNTAVENGVRLAAYANARKIGMSRPQAARMAKELTVNFNKSGEYGTVLNSMYLFFNAAVQGNVRFFKAMTTLKSTVQEDGSVKKSLNRGQKLALALTAFSSVMVLINQGLSDDDEDGESFYSKIPDFEKERNLIMMNPFNGRDYFKIPLPYGYNVFHNFGMITAEVASGDREVGDGIGFLTSAMVGAFSPVSFGGGDNTSAVDQFANAFTPTIAKPILDLARNEDYFGSQIYNENFPMGTPKPESSMGRRTTPEVFKQISTFLNEVTGGNAAESGGIDIAPESMYYIYKFAIGGTGKFLQNVAETAGTAIDIAGGQEKELETRKLPFVRKVYGEPNKYADQATFFDNYDEVRQKLEAVKQKVASEKDMENISGIAATEGAYKEISKQLKELREFKKAAEKIEDPVKRTAKLNKLDERYYALIRKANGVYNKRMK